MTVASFIQHAGGVVRVASLFDEGYSPHDLRKAVARDGLIRPRRGWVALRDADPELVNAASHGVVLGCITQARRLGLWVLEEDRLHVAAPRGRHIALEHARIHRRRPLAPRPPGILADGIDNLLDCVAHCQPHRSALAVWDSALQRGLTDLQKLSTLPLGPKSRRLLTEATPFSDSGLETFFRTALRWLQVPLRSQVWIHGHRVDFLIGDRLVVQIDGRDHVGTQRTRDNRHDGILRSRGYTVLRFTYAEIVHEWPRVQAAIIDAIARGAHLR